MTMTEPGGIVTMTMTITTVGHTTTGVTDTMIVVEMSDFDRRIRRRDGCHLDVRLYCGCQYATTRQEAATESMRTNLQTIIVQARGGHRRARLGMELAGVRVQLHRSRQPTRRARCLKMAR